MDRCGAGRSACREDASTWTPPRAGHLFPGTGQWDQTGGPAPAGMTVNVPLPLGATGDVLLAALDAPRAEVFAPTWVLVSAGFDGHRADPMEGFALSAGDCADLSARVAAFAPAAGRLVSFLGGGYDSTRSAARSARPGRPPWAAGSRPEPSTNGGRGRQLVAELARR